MRSSLAQREATPTAITTTCRHDTRQRRPPSDRGGSCVMATVEWCSVNAPRMQHKSSWRWRWWRWCSHRGALNVENGDDDVVMDKMTIFVALCEAGCQRAWKYVHICCYCCCSIFFSYHFLDFALIPVGSLCKHLSALTQRPHVHKPNLSTYVCKYQIHTHTYVCI